jgi:hypothetical protein
MGKDEITREIVEIIQTNKSKEMMLTKIKQELEKRHPSFNYAELGFTRFSKLVASIPEVSVSKNAAKIK